jgi:MADS-box transcription factor
MRRFYAVFCLSSWQFDGERDTRNPNDFTNGSDSKLDDILEGDDDDAQEDEPEPIPTRGPVGTKRSGDAKAKVDVGVKAKQSATKGVVPTPDVSAILFPDVVVVNIKLSCRWILSPIVR